jgi:hypothetical protein
VSKSHLVLIWVVMNLEGISDKTFHFISWGWNLAPVDQGKQTTGAVL